MKDFRVSKTFRPYRGHGVLPVHNDHGRVEEKLIDQNVCQGYMSQGFKARLFKAAQETLTSADPEVAKRLSGMANYLTSISVEDSPRTNVENFSWMVGSRTRQDPEQIQRAMEPFADTGRQYDPISQADAIRYSRFGRSSLQLVRVPTLEDQVHDAAQLPVSLEILSKPGPEMLALCSETIVRTIYPTPNTPAQ